MTYNNTLEVFWRRTASLYKAYQNAKDPDMKRIWDFINNGYIPVRGMNHKGKLSIKLLVLLIAVIIATNYYLI